jgi:hypothetical protein
MTDEQKIKEVIDRLDGYARGTRPLTVADIRQALQGVPDDMPVRNHNWRLLLQTVADLRKELADKHEDQIPRDDGDHYQRPFTWAAEVVDDTRGSMRHEPAFVLGHHERDPMHGDLCELIHFFGFEP